MFADPVQSVILCCPRLYDVGFTDNVFSVPPAVFGGMQTANGGDPSHNRLGPAGTTASGTSVFVEEETCSDGEMNHIAETFGIFAVQTGVAGSAAGVRFVQLVSLFPKTRIVRQLTGQLGVHGGRLASPSSRR